MTASTAPAIPTPSLAPYLFYDDVERAARFMQEAFGFALVFTSPGPHGGLAHAQLAHGSGLIMVGHAGGGGLNLVKSAGALEALHAGVYVFVLPATLFGVASSAGTAPFMTGNAHDRSLPVCC